MLKLRSIALILVAAFAIMGCSGSSSDNGSSKIYAIKDPLDAEPRVVSMVAGGPVVDGPVIDYATILNQTSETFSFPTPRSSAYDSHNKAIVTIVDTDVGEILASISVADGIITEFTNVEFSGESIVAFYTTGDALKVLLSDNGDGALRLSTISLATKLATSSLAITIDDSAIAVAGAPRGDNYFVDSTAGKLYFLGDNGATLHLFVVDLSSGVLSTVSGALTYDSTYSCLFNNGTKVGVISDHGGNNVEIISIAKSDGAVTSTALDTLGIRGSTDRARFVNDYVHTATGTTVYGVVTVNNEDNSSIVDHLFTLNKATMEIKSVDNTIGCYYTIVLSN